MKKEFFNRELSWLEFNARVLSEALEAENPPLERLKFLAIVANNFDEFFMVRVAGLKRQLEKGNYVRCPSGMSPRTQLDKIRLRVAEIIAEAYRCLHAEVFPELSSHGLKRIQAEEFSLYQRRYVKELFDESIFPLLTPVRSEGGKPLSQAVNLRINLAFLLEASEESNPLEPVHEKENFAVLQVPRTLDRIVFLPSESEDVHFALVEDVIEQHAHSLFPGYAIKESINFRVTRDADMGVDEERDEDFLEAMEEILVSRRSSAAVRLSVNKTNSRLKELLKESFNLAEEDVYITPGPLDLGTLMDLTFQSGFDHLRNEEWRPVKPPEVPEDEPMWDVLKQQDVLFYHPYESFLPVINLVQEAAIDPGVLAIKMTLYRTSGDSPIVRALERAANEGKQVTALVELKARFDEERNIEWAQRLEKAGVIVVYGIAGLKVHSKALLIVRREDDEIRRYVHLGTGNYNDKTAKLYTDLGLLTSREDFTYETSLFFNAITGYSSVPQLQKLIMAPTVMKERVLSLIDREARRSNEGNPGKIIARMNALSDPDVIRALYNASNAGVEILFNVRGICMLVPGVEGMSENITVISIIDRFLEHARIYYFHNGGMEEIYCASADWMPRNLERRVELMFPIEQNDIKRRLMEYLEIFFRDNVKSHILQSDGTYVKKQPKSGQEKQRSQELIFKMLSERSGEIHKQDTKEFVVRRKSPPASKR